MTVQPEAFFLPTVVGQRFCLYYPALGSAVTGLAIYVHPFAEEMNKARRMAAVQARALAQAGYSVLQIDLHGCGDSSGNFGDATWQSWVSDVVQGCQWLRHRASSDGVDLNKTPLWLWGLRTGCLIAAQAASQIEEPCNFLFWQPPSTGKQLLQQFMRLKVAVDMLSGQSKGVMESMRQRLAQGSPVEIAGYVLSAGLALGLEQATLSPSAIKTDVQRLEWFEVSTREDASLSPVSAKTFDNWRQAGFQTSSHIVLGPSFWQTSEIEDAPELITKTTESLVAGPA